MDELKTQQNNFDKDVLEDADYNNRFNALPDDLKEAFTSETVTNNIVSAGKAHGLMVDQIGKLGDEVGLVMLGVTPTTDFIKNLVDRLGKKKEKTKSKN